jgi:hypothetical protein
MEDRMFNSPLHYCIKCKTYVELDQTKDECAALHACGGVDCPLQNMFRPPAPMDKSKSATAAQPPANPKPAK